MYRNDFAYDVKEHAWIRSKTETAVIYRTMDSVHLSNAIFV